METKWNPQNKSQYSQYYRNGGKENIWSECPDDELPELKKKFDKKRFGCRRVEGESDAGGPIMQPEHDPNNAEAKMNHSRRGK